MKKFTLLFAVAAILSLSTIGAAAYAPVDGSYTIVYDAPAGAKEGDMYGLLAVTPKDGVVNTSNTDNIVYIDQASVVNGKITFSDFAPMGVAPTEAGYVESTVFIGGPGLNTAKEIGKLEAVVSGTATAITGKVVDTVTVAGSSKVAQVTVVTPSTVAGEPDVTVAGPKDVNADGTFSIDVPAGTYSVVITKPGFCSYTYTGVTVGATEIELDEANITTLAGDVFTDNMVNIDDITELLIYYTNTGEAIKNKSADVDGDNQVVIDDITALLTSYTNVGVKVPYSGN